MSFWGRIGYYGESNAYPTLCNIHFNCFKDNAQGFVWEGNTIMNAENNWWGNISGPQHPDNPGGTGDNVSGEVDFVPWLMYYGPETSLPLVNIISPFQRYININILDLFSFKIRFFTTVAIGKTKVAATASDNQSGIERIEFYVDEELKATLYSAPYNWTWSERGLFFPYTLKVVAYDYYGNFNSMSMKVWKIF